MHKKRLDKKATADLKIYGVRDWAKIMAIHILPNISGTKDNQTVELGQLIKYNVRKIFLRR